MSDAVPPPPHIDGSLGENVWTYQGYRLESPQFITAMVHLYRAEMQRANLWRNRLDTTTNWAVVTSAAALTFAFGDTTNPHFILVLVLFLLLTFLSIEARRYRYYEIWYQRVRLLERNLFAPMMAYPHQPEPDWGPRLEHAILEPTFRSTWWEAVGIRTRRNYLWMITILVISWFAKLSIHPALALNLSTIVRRAAIGLFVPGPVVFVSVCFTYVILLIIALISALPAEKRRRFYRRRHPQHPSRAPQGIYQPSMATVVTGHGSTTAQRLMEELGRGVTALQGRGMYTGEEKDVLLCAVTDVQIERLQQIVYEIDPNAFVVVSRAARIHGYGFEDIEAPS